MDKNNQSSSSALIGFTRVGTKTIILKIPGSDNETYLKEQSTKGIYISGHAMSDDSKLLAFVAFLKRKKELLALLAAKTVLMRLR